MAAVIVPTYVAMPATAVPTFTTMPATTAVPAPASAVATLTAVFSRGRTSNCDGQRHRGDDEQS
jgi:hypothetical protein